MRHLGQLHPAGDIVDLFGASVLKVIDGLFLFLLKLGDFVSNCIWHDLTFVGFHEICFDCSPSSGIFSEIGHHFPFLYCVSSQIAAEDVAFFWLVHKIHGFHWGLESSDELHNIHCIVFWSMKDWNLHCHLGCCCLASASAIFINWFYSSIPLILFFNSHQILQYPKYCTIFRISWKITISPLLLKFGWHGFISWFT